MPDASPELPSIERQEPAPPPSLRAVMLGSLVATILGLGLFSWLADEVFEGHARRFDDTVRDAVHHYASPGLTRVMVIVSALGSEVLAVLFIVAVVTFLLLKWRRAAVWLMLTMAGGLVLQVVLKLGFHRTRPEAFFGKLPHGYRNAAGWCRHQAIS